VSPRLPRKLPPRPNLEHLRQQAKTLLSRLKAGDPDAIRAFIEHLPEARAMQPAAVRAAGFRLADAQSAVARQSGFAGWPALSRHVRDLRALEGEWRVERLEIDGSPLPHRMVEHSRILIDGDRFRTESPEAIYDGVFTIDVDAAPSHIDIDFVEGPEAGNSSYGLFELDGETLTLCLGLAGAPRPKAFTTSRGSGRALERLRRVSLARPESVTGGAPPKTSNASKSAAAPAHEDPSTFAVEMTPLMRRLEGDWVPTELVMDGKPMPPEWLAFGSRTVSGNDVTVVFGGQTMLHAKARIDERASPIALDYLNLTKAQSGTVSRGIMEWVGDEIRNLMAAPGEPRPSRFAPVARTATLSRWRKR
jgi:uncharacterized protein (TIGR03067 family)